MSTNKTVPKDLQVMMNIMSDMGITEYEPRVVNQLVEFTYRYVTEMLDEAKLFSNHFGKKNIDTDDLKMAAQIKLENSFTNPPPRELLLELAKTKNSTPLPPIKPFSGPKLPPDRYCLTNPNYQLIAIKKTSSAFMNKLGQKYNAPMNNQNNMTTTFSLISNSNQNVSYKRKRDEDDLGNT